MIPKILKTPASLDSLYIKRINLLLYLQQTVATGDLG